MLFYVVAASEADRLTNNCGHRHRLVREATACLNERGGRVFLVREQEVGT